MPDAVLISIVLPTYNGRHYLADSVQSVIDQTYANWELIIVDDCSTDDTPELIAQLAAQDERIHTIRHSQNKKLPGALNTGFDAARGAFFTWTSDDNIYRPHALQTMIDYLLANPETDVVYADYTIIDDDGESIQKVRVAPPNMLVRKSTVAVCFLYRRAVHEALNGYDESLFLIEDYDFWVRASMQFTLRALHEDLYLYRHHQQSLTTQKRQKVMQLREAMLIRHLPGLSWATPIDRARGYIHISELAVLNGHASRAVVYWFKAFQQSPGAALRHIVKVSLPPSLLRRAENLYKRSLKKDTL